MENKNIVIIGAGPAGLGCAWALTQAGKPALIIEKEDGCGGLCRTINFKGYLFDIGGHRFLTKSNEINALWNNLLNDDMLKVKRLSSIYYRGKYFRYPLSFLDTFLKLSPAESLLCFGSFLKTRLSACKACVSFEDWVTSCFGRRLFEIFFKSYTEKVLGLDCRNISADWAKQRIRNLSFISSLKESFFKNTITKTFYREFLYPRKGAGEFYDKLTETIKDYGGNFIVEKEVCKINHDGKKIVSVNISDGKNTRTLATDHLFSSMPLPALIQSLNPKAPEYVISASRALRFRSLLTVNIILNETEVFPQQWLYVHCPQIKSGRIQNYKNWSKDMVPKEENTTLCLEYFCNQTDDLWSSPDAELIKLSLRELEKLKLADASSLIDGFVMRYPHAYPVYALGYADKVSILKDYLKRFSNFQIIGRSGTFQYDNSDNALLSGIYAAKRLLMGTPDGFREIVDANGYIG